jgi:hypothetical protein
MRANLNLKSISILFSAIFLLWCGTSVKAQQTEKQTGNPAVKTSEAQKNEDVREGDVVIIANVTAKELKFEVVPNTSVEFPGKPEERKTVWEAERDNLPDKIEPGVTYRNIGIRLRIVSRFADIERIVAEALGEFPVDDSQNPAQNGSQPKENQAQPVEKPKAKPKN